MQEHESTFWDGGRVSPTPSVLVRPATVVDARITRRAVRRGAPAVVLVTVRPVRPGERVVAYQESSDKSFQAELEGRRNRLGRARLPLRTGRSGRYLVSVSSQSPVLVDDVVVLPFVVR